MFLYLHKYIPNNLEYFTLINIIKRPFSIAVGFVFLLWLHEGGLAKRFFMQLLISTVNVTSSKQRKHISKKNVLAFCRAR